MTIYDRYSEYINSFVNSNIKEWEFKSHPDYTYMLEHVDEELGKHYLRQIIAKFPVFYTTNKNMLIDLCHINDTIGKTEKHDFNEFTFCSPTNIRYILNSLLILSYMNECMLNNIDIIEIGGGYGGLCFFIHNLAKLFNITINTYSIIDLPNPMILQKKYLENLNINYPNLEKFKENSFLISNYAFGEFPLNVREKYTKDVLNPYTSYGFLAWNSIPVYDFIEGKVISTESEYIPSLVSEYVRFKPNNKIVDKVLIRDVCFAHGESSCHERKPKNFIWTREDFDTNVCFYTDYVLSKVINSPYKKNIGWLIEPPSINPNGYKQVIELKDRFDLVFTYSQELINSDPEKFKWYPHSGCWIKDSDIKIYDKSNLLSIIASNKNMTSGHMLRHEVIKEFGPSMDVFGRGIRDLKYKLDGLSSYMFSVVIENVNYDDYFTEKIIDCFATGTVPIYWGTKSVKNFFNDDGIIFFETIEELRDILYNLTEEDYTNRMDSIKYNLNKSREFILAEDWIFTKYPNCF